MIQELFELIQQKDFLALETSINAFNPFAVLKLENAELQHSNILAWLFTPDQNHNLGSSFLLQFLLSVFSKEQTQQGNLRLISALLKNGFSKITVQREKQNRDITIIHKGKTLKDSFVLVIENKINAGESLKQLEKYRLQIESDLTCKGFKKIFVFLTKRENQEPSDNHYVHITYQNIYDIITSILEKNAEEINSNANQFLKFYLKTLEKLTDMETKENELARTIYRNHRTVFDFIIKNQITPFASAGARFLAECGEKLLSTRSNGQNFFFYDQDLTDVEMARNHWSPKAFGYFFNLTEKNDEFILYLNTEVCPLADASKREEFMATLRKQGLNCSNSTTFTRVSLTKNKKIKQTIDSDYDESVLFNAMKSLFRDQEFTELRKTMKQVEEKVFN